MHREPVDLVILPVHQAEGDLFSVFEEMRKKLWTSYLPVVLLADSDDFGAGKQEVSMGIEHILPKPLDREALMEKTRQILTGN